MLHVEQLSDRIVPAVVDVVGGVMSFIDSGSENNNLTVAVGAGVYSLNDSLTNITLTQAALDAGYKGSGTKTISGPASAIDGITISLGGGTNVANIRSVNDPLTINGDSGTSTVNMNSAAPTNSGNLAGIQAEVTINAGSDTRLWASDISGASRPNPVAVTSSAITGLAPNTINLSGTFATLRVSGSNSSVLTESYTIASPPCLTFTLDTLGGADAVTVTSWEGQYGKFNGGSGSDSLTILDGISVDGAQSGYEIQLFNIAGYGELS